MAMYNCILLIPIYATGDPIDLSVITDKETNDIITLLVLTVLNITGSYPKMVTVYILVLLCYTFGVVLLMFFYLKKSLSWRFQDLSKVERYQDSDVALHAI